MKAAANTNKATWKKYVHVFFAFQGPLGVEGQPVADHRGAVGFEAVGKPSRLLERLRRAQQAQSLGSFEKLK